MPNQLPEDITSRGEAETPRYLGGVGVGSLRAGLTGFVNSRILHHCRAVRLEKQTTGDIKTLFPASQREVFSLDTQRVANALRLEPEIPPRSLVKRGESPRCPCPFHSFKHFCP